jgi:hypothetical protein
MPLAYMNVDRAENVVLASALLKGRDEGSNPHGRLPYTIALLRANSAVTPVEGMDT